MDMLGHSQISVTMNTYSHEIPSLVERRSIGRFNSHQFVRSSGQGDAGLALTVWSRRMTRWIVAK